MILHHSQRVWAMSDDDDGPDARRRPVAVHIDGSLVGPAEETFDATMWAPDPEAPNVVFFTDTNIPVPARADGWWNRVAGPDDEFPDNPVREPSFEAPLQNKEILL